MALNFGFGMSPYDYTGAPFTGTETGQPAATTQTANVNYGTSFPGYSGLEGIASLAPAAGTQGTVDTQGTVGTQGTQGTVGTQGTSTEDAALAARIAALKAQGLSSWDTDNDGIISTAERNKALGVATYGQTTNGQTTNGQIAGWDANDNGVVDTYEERIGQLMETRGWTREQAVANQAGAMQYDLDGSGFVTDAEYREALEQESIANDPARYNGAAPAGPDGQTTQVITVGLDGQNYPTPAAAYEANLQFLANLPTSGVPGDYSGLGPYPTGPWIPGQGQNPIGNLPGTDPTYEYVLPTMEDVRVDSNVGPSLAGQTVATLPTSPFMKDATPGERLLLSGQPATAASSTQQAQYAKNPFLSQDTGNANIAMAQTNQAAVQPAAVQPAAVQPAAAQPAGPAYAQQYSNITPQMTGEIEQASGFDPNNSFLTFGAGSSVNWAQAAPRGSYIRDPWMGGGRFIIKDPSGGVTTSFDEAEAMQLAGRNVSNLDLLKKLGAQDQSLQPFSVNAFSNIATNMDEIQRMNNLGYRVVVDNQG